MHLTINTLLHVAAFVACVRLLKGVSESEFAALKDFYQSTNGDSWYVNTGWEFASETNPNPNITAQDICSTVGAYGLLCYNQNIGVCYISSCNSY